MTPNWPDTATGGRLGDDRNAHATDRPSTIDELRRCVVDRVAEGHAVYPQGGGTALDYGGTPRLPGVAIDTRALNRVIEYPAADMTITVEAGITLASLQEVLASQNQRLLIDAPNPDRATLGGIFATNTCGPRRFGHGRPRDQIIGVGFVTADGEFVKGGGRVVKNVAGYDFPRLLTGSMGTLGILTVLTLKVRPLPERSNLAWIPIANPQTIAATLDGLNTSTTRPVAVELLNPTAARTLGTPLGLQTEGWTLVVGFEDNAESVPWQLDRLKSELSGSPFEILQENAVAPLWNALTEYQAVNGGSLSFAAAVRPSSVAAFALSLDPETWAVQAHAGNGIVRAHRLQTGDLETIATELATLRNRAVRDGGHLTITRCPAEWKPRLLVWGEPRPDWVLSQRIKQTFDPRGVMNPGRFIGTI